MKTRTTLFLSAALAGVIGLSCSKGSGFWDSFIPETDEEPTSAQVTGYVFRPALVPATPERIQQLKVPTGFKVQAFAQEVGKPRILAVSSQGYVYVSDRDAGMVTLLEDKDKDGVAERKQMVASIKQAHGLAIHNSKLYIAAVQDLYVADINSDGTLSQPKLIKSGLPDGGQHPNRTLAFGPDGLMYFSIGSTCNSCPEPNAMHATMVRMNADGSNMKIYAKGLRNTIGFGWHPETKEFWGMDHGIDWLGDEEQKEEVNLIKENGVYGWPYIYEDGKYNPGTRPPGDTTYQQYSQLSTKPSLTYQAHAAPMQMAFYTGSQFPSDYQGDAFVAMRGSWNRSKPSGYSVVRMHFENGKPVRFEDFLTGFLVDNNRSHIGRPVGVAVHADGSLLVSDDTNGVIYRISRQ
ncbi:oxidoreductase [Siphonobacter sp. BAB-5405]|uniref:PQQ-dependent sugar dehydrogenase n=2 Tax=unclassified Siphonobacter TaxID=2635712 RepID=UPI000C80E8C4|nr:PQQ-dependent sugar dehydrogenase [Siphonobacter sp. BAB-5405]PMD91424.1 oxidoreductase [Siphonobacter sp. BAB-5405]